MATRSDVLYNIYYKAILVTSVIQDWMFFSLLNQIKVKYTVNPFNLAAIKFCAFKDSKFHCFNNLLFSNCTHML